MNTIKVANHNELILLDDDEMEIDILQRILKRSKLTNPFLGFQVAAEFFDYLEEVKQGNRPMPALVLIDIRMPGMDGFGVVRRVREDEFFKVLPLVVMFSNSDSRRDTEEARRVGAHGFQVKPSGTDAYVEFLNSLAPAD